MTVDNAPKPWVCVNCSEDQAADETRYERFEPVFMTARWHGPLCSVCHMKYELYDPQESDDAR